MQSWTPRIWGLDIGGANLKCADSGEFTRQMEFPLWKHSRQLPEALQQLLPDGSDDAPAACAVTMTGELADCFETKSQGIGHILACVEQVCGPALPVFVYGNDGHWYTGQAARRASRAVAAANWHALSAAVSLSLTTPRGLLVDVGSTTVDVIPLTPFGPQAKGKTDTERLLARELIYMGVIRTPLCGLLTALPYRGQVCPIAREWFATTLDAYLVLGLVSADPHRCDTADGREWSRDRAVSRLGRMFCADEQEFDVQDAMLAAEAVFNLQQQIMGEAIKHALDLPAPALAAADWTIVLAGEGEFLTREVIQARFSSHRTLSLSDVWGPERSRVGPAYAVARLLQRAIMDGTVCVASDGRP